MDQFSQEIIRVHAYDGQYVWLSKQQQLLEIGNLLGTGVAGEVYECEQIQTHETYALKILHPICYKIMSPALLKRFKVISSGQPFDDTSSSTNKLTFANVYWLFNESTRQYVAAFHSNKTHGFKELSLSQCIDLWGFSPEAVGLEESSDKTEIIGNITIPVVPPKFSDFVRKRNLIFREIRNMRTISSHPNVIKLESVLEHVNDSKSVIFLMMELANGGELFDRIKLDKGTREETAKIFFKQLLDGVHHCHNQGVCHRDLKPENLLLQDEDNKTILKIADFGFSTHIFVEQYPSDIVQQNALEIYNNTASAPSSFHSGNPIRMLKSVVGSPFYVAPEVMQARGYYGPKADVWSIGVILYAMLAGNLPFGKDLSICDLFRKFCKWVRSETSKGTNFIESQSVEYPSWLFSNRFSSSTKGLIVSMLHPDPNFRISVIDAMKHSLYISGESHSPIPYSNVDYLHQNTLNSISPFENSNQNSNSFTNSNQDLYPSSDVFFLDEDDSNLSCSMEVTSRLVINDTNDNSALNLFNVQEQRSRSQSAPIVPTCYLDNTLVQDLIPPTTCLPDEEVSTPTIRSSLPQFNDNVKKSTRFTTAVPADKVLSTVESILRDVQLRKLETPIGIINKIEVNWDNYRLDVWGPDSSGPSICSLQLYQIPYSGGSFQEKVLPFTVNKDIPTLHLVEFVRGQIEIFDFKKFYQWIRLKISELVSRDYSLGVFDQACSPALESFIQQRAF